MKKLISLAAFVFFSAAFLSLSSAAQAATYNWDFTSASSVSASGQLTVTANNQVTALSGNVGGQAITFYGNPNFPATSTLHGVPNTGGADYIYDDFFNPATNTVGGILISIGAPGPSQLYYFLYGTGGANADLFSIVTTPSYTYVYNEGVMSSSAVAATPLPPTWTMLIAAMAGLSFFAWRAKKNSAAPVRNI